MQQTEIHQFLKKYFTAHNCDLTEDDPSYLKVQLTIEMDKELMNRPFYWHYIEKTGGKPNPASLTFITDPTYDDSSVQGEKFTLAHRVYIKFLGQPKSLEDSFTYMKKCILTHNRSVHFSLGLL